MTMFDTIILLTGAVEGPLFTALLQAFNPQLSVIVIDNNAALAALPPELLRRARLIGFTTPVIVPKGVLNALGFGAYNFHPGPPHYPGWLPAQFALYDDAREFGATAHRMVARVDEGPIVGVERFAVPANITVGGLEGLAYAHLARLFWQLAQPLATQPAPLAEIGARWSGVKSTRRMFAAMCDLPLDIPAEEFSAALIDEVMQRLHCTASDFGRPMAVAS